MSKPLEALAHFEIKGAINSVALFGGGHINDTYHVKTSDGEFLLQRVNTAVFTNPEVLEENLEGLFSDQSEILVPHVKTKTGQWLLHFQNDIWKMQVFDNDVYAPTLATELDLVHEIGKGFGKFTALSIKYEVSNFEEAIPNFHNLKWRIRQLDEAVENNYAQRIEEAKIYIDKANQFRWISDKMDDLIGKGLPLRVCHNDTKIDNILLSKASNQFNYVIDLDTVGPGYVLYDFGDMMRTLLSPTKENERDESKVILRADYLKQIHLGYLKECEEILTPLEIESLTFGGLYMTYMIAIRFLADYLNGDTYYKVNFPEENMIRARNQFRLLELMEGWSDHRSDL
jgi:Ser/Thr protein kinase RdoA (MazF antagonist)